MIYTTVIKFLFKYRLSVCAYLAVAVLSLVPVKEFHLDHVSLNDKLAHFLMYGGLSFALFIELLIEKSAKCKLKTSFLYAFVCPIAYGGLMEILQEFLTTFRSGDWLDLFADAIGVSIAYVVIFTISKFLR